MEPSGYRDSIGLFGTASFDDGRSLRSICLFYTTRVIVGFLRGDGPAGFQGECAASFCQ